MPRKVEISHRTIIFTVLFLLGLWFLYYVKDIIIELFIALLLATILEPLVNFLSKIKVPRGVSVFLSYIVFFGIFGGSFALVVPMLLEQTASFVNALPGYLSQYGFISSEILTRLGSLPSQLIQFTFSIFSNLISLLTIMVFAFYMLLSRGKLEEQLGAFFGEARKKEIGKVVNILEDRLGGWARGQLTLMALIGVITFIGLSLMGIPFALPLAILAGILEIIPYLGPIVAAVPSILIAFGISPVAGVGVMALAFLIQQVENYVLVPKVMEKSVGVSPILTLIALAIGARLEGIVGMIISIPVLITIQVILSALESSKPDSVTT